MLSSRHLAALAAALTFGFSASAQTVTWANLGTDFSSGLNWVGLAAPTSGQVAVFSTPLTLTNQPVLNSAFTLGGLQISSGAASVNFTGTGTLTILSSGISVLSTGSHTIGVGLAFNSSSSTVTSEGSLSLTGNIANTTSSGLTFGGNGNSTVSGVISGSGTVVVDAGGTWTFSGLNTYTGTTVLNAGRLKISADSNLGQAPSSVSSAALTIDGGKLETTASFVLAANRGIMIGGSGGELETDSGTTLTYGGQILASNGGGLTKSGTGTLQLNGANSYFDHTFIAAGTLADGATGSLSPNSKHLIASGANLAINYNETVGGLSDYGVGGGNVTIGVGKTLTLSGGDTFSGVISGGGALVLGDASMNQTLTGNNTYAGGTMIGTDATLQIGLGGTAGAIVSGNITNNGTLLFERSDTITYGGITGSGMIQQDGTGSLRLSGVNSYTGATWITGGTVTDANLGAFSSASFVQMYGGNLAVNFNETIAGLGDLDFDGTLGGNVTLAPSTTLSIADGSSFSGNIGGNGTLKILDGAWQTFTGNVSSTVGTTIDHGGTLQIGQGGTGGTIAGAILNNGDLEFDRSGTITASGLTGIGNVTQFGSGTLTLSGTGNTYSGATYVTNGVFSDANANAYSPNSPIRVTGEGTQLNVNNAETIAGLGGSFSSSTTTVNLGATLTINGPNLTYNGVISGTGSLVVNGPGSQTLGGNNLFTSGVAITNGTLIATNSSGSATGTGSVSIGNGGTLQFGNGGTAGMVSGNIVNNGTVLFNRADSGVVYSGVISGSGQLSIGFSGSSSTGELKLTGTNTYSGSTNLNSGTLTVGATNTLPLGTTVQFGGGGELKVQQSQTLAAIGGNTTGATIEIVDGATLTLAPASNVYGGAFAGALIGNGSLAITAASNTGVSINGNNSTFTGATTISSGTLWVGQSNGLGTGNISVSAGGKLAMDKTASADVVLPNAVSLASGASLASFSDKNRTLKLTGTVTIPTGGVTLHLGDVVQFAGNLRAAASGGQLTIDSGTSGFGHTLFTGTIDPTITTLTLNAAGVIFGSTTAVPSAGALSVKATTGYVGIAGVSGAAPSASSVIGLLDTANFTGVLGFDTVSSSGAPATFSDAIDVSAFGANLTLGSASSAVLTGTITPSASGYLFGNGGGSLVINSALTGSRSVDVNSLTAIPGNYLLTVFRGANTFTGAMRVTNSIAIFDSATALPAGQSLVLGAYGYAGYTENFTGVSSFSDFAKNRIATGSYTATSVIGVDSGTYIANELASGSTIGTRTLNDTIDLRSLSSIYLGTTTRAIINGQIYAPTQGGANKALSLLAARDSELTINSPLLAGQVNSVVIGSSASPYAKGSITITGTNNYAGGTTLLSGNLIVGGSSRTTSGVTTSGPLGTGTITVPANASATLVPKNYIISLNNALSLGSALNLGVTYSMSSDSSPLGLLYGFNNLTLNGVISDLDGTNHGSLDIHANTVLNAANTFTGGVTLHDGTLTVGNNAALGSGTLTLAPGLNGGMFGATLSTTSTSSGVRTIANNLVFTGASQTPLSFGGNASFQFTGSLALNNSAMFAPGNYAVTFAGPITGGGRLVVNGSNIINLTGSNTYTGGTASQAGAIIFANAGAMPATPNLNAFSSDFSGYIGVAFDPGAGLQSTFIDRFNKGSTYGAIGFDSPGSTALTFTGDINLSSFTSDPRLGSATSAVLTGTITPSDSTYSFGNGGGLLEVRSNLTDDGTVSRDVTVISDYRAPLTLRLTGTNTFTDGVSIYNSGVIFGANALPATGSIVPLTGSYVGTEDTTFASNPTLFANRLFSLSTGVIVGFDSFTSGTPYALTGNLSLANFTSSTDPKIYVGTATSATISGAITLPTAQSAYRFAGYKGGQLTVQTNLGDGATARSVVIGDATNKATFSTPTLAGSTLSSVTLSGANSYSGGTTLEAGVLYVGNDSALGTGALTVANNSTGDGRHLGLLASGAARTLSNALVLGSANLDFGGSYSLTLGGNITGNSSASLKKVGTAAAVLTGDNSQYFGRMIIQSGAVTFQTGNSVGGGALYFDSTGAASATFADSATVNGIFGSSSTDTINLTAGRTLVVNQSLDADYKGVFAGTTAGLVLSSTSANLRLSGASTFTGPTTIQNNIVVTAGSASAFGLSTNAVSMTGGTLLVDSGITLTNPIAASGGTLGGVGTFKAATGSSGYTIGTGVAISPGLSAPGALTFDGSLITSSVLILTGGGTYKWGLMDASSAGGWSTISVVGGTGAVTITSSQSTPFTFKISSLLSDGSSGLAANFDSTQNYSWSVLTATSITGFNANAFTIDTSGFFNPNSGTFSLSLSGGNTLMLNFSPVPEPSTYALMAVGAALLALGYRRRRRIVTSREVR